jgi:hypothetical protein
MQPGNAMDAALLQDLQLLACCMMRQCAAVALPGHLHVSACRSIRGTLPVMLHLQSLAGADAGDNSEVEADGAALQLGSCPVPNR